MSSNAASDRLPTVPATLLLIKAASASNPAAAVRASYAASADACCFACLATLSSGTNAACGKWAHPRASKASDGLPCRLSALPRSRHIAATAARCSTDSNFSIGRSASDLQRQGPCAIELQLHCVCVCVLSEEILWKFEWGLPAEAHLCFVKFAGGQRGSASLPAVQRRIRRRWHCRQRPDGAAALSKPRATTAAAAEREAGPAPHVGRLGQLPKPA